MDKIFDEIQDYSKSFSDKVLKETPNYKNDIDVE
jgi:hypothetical protein